MNAGEYMRHARRQFDYDRALREAMTDEAFDQLAERIVAENREAFALLEPYDGPTTNHVPDGTPTHGDDPS